MAALKFNRRFNRNLLILLTVISFLFGVLTTRLYYVFSSANASEALEFDETPYFLIVLIITAPGNLDKRNVIRETWLNLRPNTINDTIYQNELIYIPRWSADGFLELESVDEQKRLLEKYHKSIDIKEVKLKKTNYKLKHYFVIGTQGLSKATLKDVREERTLYSDIILLPQLVDSYKNLTRKIIQSFKVLNESTKFKYILKCDDDSYVKLDVLLQDLLNYDAKLTARGLHNQLDLYWGYFNGRARIKSDGAWKETRFNLCDRYVPYSLGGGYVVSHNIAKYVAMYADILSSYLSEDISLGTWLAPFKNIHKRHDIRFDTAYMPRHCKNYHIVLHKRDVKQMRDIYAGRMCTHENMANQNVRRPAEYFYDWTQVPTKCCDALDHDTK
jgi:galactosylxylosylprotein 3-beta-galactosyltransferase